MQYLIEGADKSSGQDRSVIVSADNPREAEKQAEEMDLLISSVKPHAAGIPSGKAIEYASPRAGVDLRNVPPRYLGLQIASILLGVSCAMFYGLAALVAIVSILVSATAAQVPGQLVPMRVFAAATGFSGLMYALMLFACGAIQHGLSAGCSALRDIARNSFG